VSRRSGHARGDHFVLLAAALAASILVGCAETTGAVATSGGFAGNESVASDFSARDVDGKTLRLSDYLGKQAILLDFWSTYCEPCLAEMPHLRQMYDEQKAKGFVVIGVAMDGPETVAEVPSFTKRNGMTFPVVLDEDSHVAQIYNPKKAAPLSVLIDKKGKIFRVREGYNPGDEKLVEADVLKVLEPPAPATSATAPTTP
jgi:peroxiredoxin